MDSLNLTPAESLIFISPNSSGIEMIKITLLDLLLRRVLGVNVGEQESKFLKSHNKTILISKGDITGLNLKPHEEILVDLISNYSELELKEFAELIHYKINSMKYKDGCIRDHLVDTGYLRRQRKMLLSLIPHTRYVLTDKGLEIKNKITNLLDEAKYLERWIKEDLGKAKAYLSVIGTHILLLNVYDLEDIKKFNKILSQIKPESKPSNYFNYYLYSVPMDYLDENGDIDSFDFIDMSVLDNFHSWNEFYSYFDTELDIAPGNEEE